MEVVAHLAGERHSDRPACACPVLSAFARALNDRISTDADRTRLLGPAAPLLVGSLDTSKELERVRLLVDLAVQRWFPAYLEIDVAPGQAKAMRGLDAVSCTATARAALNAASAYARAAGAAAYACADYARAAGAAADAAYASDYARAAGAAADAAYAASACARAAGAAADAAYADAVYASAYARAAGDAASYAAYAASSASSSDAAACLIAILKGEDPRLTVPFVSE